MIPEEKRELVRLIGEEQLAYLILNQIFEREVFVRGILNRNHKNKNMDFWFVMEENGGSITLH